MIEQTIDYRQKIALGETVFKILGEGEVEEGVLVKDMKEALDLYIKQGEDLVLMNAVLKPWQTANSKPTDRHIIWVIRKKGNEGKTWF